MEESKIINKIYTKILLNDNICINYNNVNKNTEEILKNSIKNKIEGKCINDGYVKIDSVKILSYSAGELLSNYVVFNIVYECEICNPSTYTNLTCNVKNITKAGIKAELDINPSPLLIFIARDHHYNNKEFSNIKIDDVIDVNILGNRYELNDTFISVIAELIGINKTETSKKSIKNI